jgi:hypothetical protein
LDERLEEPPPTDEPRGVFELFPRDEDAPLSREPEDDADAE